MSNFDTQAKRLQYLMASLNINQDELATRMNIDRTKLTSILEGIEEITEDMAKTLLVKNDVSVDWIINGNKFEKVKNNINFKETPRDRLRLFMEDHDLTQTQLADKIGQSRTSITNYLGNSNIPEPFFISIGAIYNINPDWFIYGKKPYHKFSSERWKVKFKKIENAWDLLTEKDAIFFTELIEYLKNRRAFSHSLRQVQNREINVYVKQTGGFLMHPNEKDLPIEIEKSTVTFWPKELLSESHNYFAIYMPDNTLSNEAILMGDMILCKEKPDDNINEIQANEFICIEINNQLTLRKLKNNALLLSRIEDVIHIKKNEKITSPKIYGIMAALRRFV
jgi:transcriptional regulator with XRE-family HTH domain